MKRTTNMLLIIATIRKETITAEITTEIMATIIMILVTKTKENTDTTQAIQNIKPIITETSVETFTKIKNTTKNKTKARENKQITIITKKP